MTPVEPPPGEGAPHRLLPSTPPCPFCGGTETELVSPFGSALSLATYWCRGCRTAFELVKWSGKEEE